MSDMTIVPPVPPGEVPGPAIEPMLALVERATRDQTVDVEKMEKLLAMAERLQARKAESEYDSAMNAAQGEMLPVANDSDNPQTRSRYASYGALDRAVRPIYVAHGFSLSFGTKPAGQDRVIVTCRISHRAGHTERVEIEMPADGKGAKGGDVQTKTHATGSAVSYGMRYLLKMIFNIAVGEYDDDGNAAAGRKPWRRAQDVGDDGKNPPPSDPPVGHSTGQPATRPASPASKPWDLKKFESFCMAKLVFLAKNDWTWWKYAVDKGWILPTETIDAMVATGHACSDNVFNLDPALTPEMNKARAAAAFDAHKSAMEAMVATMGQEECDVVKKAFVLVVPGASATTPTGAAAASTPAAAASPPQAEHPSRPQAPGPQTRNCPHCRSTATEPSEDYEAVTWCQKCGWQWDSAGKPFEAHEWAKVICPIPPRGTKKADYKPETLGQICRTDNSRWFGLIMNNTEEKTRAGWDYKGKHYEPSKVDIAFAIACEQAKAYTESQKDDDQGDGSDDVPY